MVASGFKVIVAGGGPVGLTAAHALEKAGIDFVLLEQRPQIVIDAGSNLVLSPLGLRALAEFGLDAPLAKVGTPMGITNRLDHKGRNIGDVHVFDTIKERTGATPTVLSRHDLTQLLYGQLSPESQSKVHAGKKVARIIPADDGVQVVCEDGTSYAGSMVLGADGAHSRVRTLMRLLALEQGSAAVNAEQPFRTTYRAMWIRMPLDARLPIGTVSETHGPGATTQLFAGYDSTVIGIYERLDAPTRARQRYTAADQDAFIARWDRLPLLPGGALTLGDAYRSRKESGLVSLEEGVVAHWSWAGRVVLAGDAAHKFTPSTGAGCNNGMIDVVALVNTLYAALSSNADPSSAALAAVFRSYQAQRMATVQTTCAAAGRATATASWATPLHRFLDRHVFSSRTLTKLLVGGGKGDPTPGSIYDFVHQQRLVTAA